MVTKKIVMVIIVAIIIVVSATYISSQKQETFKIGALLYLTGDLAEAAEAFRDGILLAADEINSNGGINGKSIEIIIEDDQFKQANVVTGAQKLVSVNKVDAAIAGSFWEAQATSNIFEESKTPLIVLWDSNPQLDNMGDYIFAIGPWTPSAGESAADFSYNTLDARKVVIINNLDPWSSEVSAIFKKIFEQLGGTILDQYSVSSEETNDFRTVITKAKSLNPDAIYSPLSEGMTTFYIQLKESGYRGNVVTSDIITENTIDVTKGATEGIYQTQILDPVSEKTQHMKEIYRKKFGKETTHVLYNAWGYDAVHMIVEAARRCADSICIKDNLYGIQNFGGASARISINENGSSPMMESIFQIRNGTFVLIKK